MQAKGQPMWPSSKRGPEEDLLSWPPRVYSLALWDTFLSLALEGLV